MRVDNFPRPFRPTAFDAADLSVFSGAFSEILLSLIPTGRSVSFRVDSAVPAGSAGSAKKADSSEDLPGHARRAGKSGGDTFVLPLEHYGGKGVTAIVDGIDQTVFARTSIDWLEDVAAEAAASFIELKQAGTDPVTGSYNLPLLHQLLTGMGPSRDLQLILIELMPPARTPRETFSLVRRAGTLLAEHDGYGFPRFHLGQAIFAIMVLDRPRQFLKKYCLELVSYLKNRGVKRVHCGSSSLLLNGQESRESDSRGTRLLDEAWTALHAACKRGPFAFCDYDLLANPDHFSLRPPSRSVRARLQRCWKQTERFALVLFSPDYLPGERLAELAEERFAAERYVLAEGVVYLLRPGETAFEAKQWAEQKIDLIVAQNGTGASLSAGIAEFPFLRFHRSETVINCQKALLHGSFFGPGSAVVFDSVSLNVSGDAYFSEGDLSGAVREYRRGLEVAPDDINLLNSLGVAYAMMNRSRQAKAAFSAVIERDPENFMALYNRGLEEQGAGDHLAAVSSLRQALGVAGKNVDLQAQAEDDARYRLAISCFQTGDYQTTIELLERWYRQHHATRRAGRCCRYLGLACHRLGRFRAAVPWLQRAVVFDEFDAESISLLGWLYFESGEGEEVAFSLLEKGVELDDRNPENLLRYGHCLNLVGRYQEARQILGRCARRPQTRHRAWLELLLACQGLEQPARARYYRSKILAAADIDAALQDQARESGL